MGNLIQTKTKTSVSPKVAVGVMLVVIGVALGAVAFNGLVPTFLEPSIDKTVQAATATGWTLVFGDGKNTSTDYNNLLAKVKEGADIKVKISDAYGSGFAINCNSLYWTNTMTLCYGFTEDGGTPNYRNTTIQPRALSSGGMGVQAWQTTYTPNGSGNFSISVVDTTYAGKQYWYYKF